MSDAGALVLVVEDEPQMRRSSGPRCARTGIA